MVWRSEKGTSPTSSHLFGQSRRGHPSGVPNLSTAHPRTSLAARNTCLTCWGRLRNAAECKSPTGPNCVCGVTKYKRTAHNPQLYPGYDGRSASEARWRPQNHVQADRKGHGLSAGTHVCTVRQSQPELCAQSGTVVLRTNLPMILRTVRMQLRSQLVELSPGLVEYLRKAILKAD